MIFENLTDVNVVLYAAKCYEKPSCVMSEFEEDYKRIQYIKRLLQKYRMSGILKERLILNHLVIAQNVFGPEACTRMLFLRINPKDYPALKTFLILTSAMPDVVRGINGNDIMSSDIPLDMNLVDTLRKL